MGLLIRFISDSMTHRVPQRSALILDSWEVLAILLVLGTELRMIIPKSVFFVTRRLTMTIVK